MKIINLVNGNSKRRLVKIDCIDVICVVSNLLRLVVIELGKWLVKICLMVDIVGRVVMGL